MKRFLALLLALVMVLSFAACSENETANNNDNNVSENNSEEKTEITKDNIMVGFIHIGDPSDMGYTYNHDLGTKKMAENLGLRDDQIINKYNIGENETCATAIEELVEAG